MSTSFKTLSLTDKDMVNDLVRTHWGDYLETLFRSSEGLLTDRHMLEIVDNIT